MRVIASENQFIQAKSGIGSRNLSKQLISLVVNGNTTVSGTCAVPPGSWLSTIVSETNTAITGTPTSCLLTIGTTAAGVDIVASVDVKGAADLTNTIVAAFDRINGLANISTIFATLVTSGGTASAGTVNVTIAYDPPVL